MALYQNVHPLIALVRGDVVAGLPGGELGRV